MEMSQNMGLTDRIIRAAVGGMLFSCGKEKKNFFTFGMGLAFIFYALSGWDPLLSLFKTTTHPDDENGLLKKCLRKERGDSTHGNSGGSSEENPS